MFFTASTKIGVASFTASSAARFSTFKPSSARELNPILLNPASTFRNSGGKRIFTASFLKKPSVAVSFVTCLVIPLFKASRKPAATLVLPIVPSVGY